MLDGRYVLAVSGGVDSVVMLDMLSRLPNLELVVAHFDHGIRDESHEDRELVQELANKYQLPFEFERVELGKNASEEIARKKRYDFLKRIAGKYSATLVTAHHADDVIETIAINFTRGTGWRGLAVLDSGIIRPMTKLTKSEILDYAKKNGLIWHEDSTNKSDKYLRNRIRQKLLNLDDDSKRQLLGLWQQQKNTKKEINTIINEICAINEVYSRSIVDNMDENAAIEIIRHITFGRLTRPQMKKVLIAIKTFLPSKICYPGGDVRIDFSSRNLTVKLIK